MILTSLDQYFDYDSEENVKAPRLNLKRRRPYTAIGIARVPCARCGKPSTQQWQVCALDNVYLGVCTECDVALNEWAVLFFRLIPNADETIRRYREKLSA